VERRRGTADELEHDQLPQAGVMGDEKSAHHGLDGEIRAVQADHHELAGQAVRDHAADEQRRDRASVRAAKTRPVSVAEPVRSSTANASAIGTRFVPKNEIVLPG
jgi:hypothetical protein